MCGYARNPQLGEQRRDDSDINVRNGRPPGVTQAVADPAVGQPPQAPELLRLIHWPRRRCRHSPALVSQRVHGTGTIGPTGNRASKHVTPRRAPSPNDRQAVDSSVGRDARMPPAASASGGPRLFLPPSGLCWTGSSTPVTRSSPTDPATGRTNARGASSPQKENMRKNTHKPGPGELRDHYP